MLSPFCGSALFGCFFGRCFFFSLDFLIGRRFLNRCFFGWGFFHDFNRRSGFFGLGVLGLFRSHLFASSLNHFLHALGEHSGHVLRLAFGFDGSLNHLVALLDGLVQVLEDLHVGDVPVVSCLHFGDGQTQIVVQFFCDAEDLAESVLFTRILLFHLFQFRSRCSTRLEFFVAFISSSRTRRPFRR